MIIRSRIRIPSSDIFVIASPVEELPFVESAILIIALVDSLLYMIEYFIFKVSQRKKLIGTNNKKKM